MKFCFRIRGSSLIRRLCGWPEEVRDFIACRASNGFAFDIDEFRSALTPRTKVVVCISPSNPTGRTLSKMIWRDWEVLGDHGAYVISDEIYRDLYYTTSGRDRCRRFTIARS